MKSCSANGKDWVDLDDREWEICSLISANHQATKFGELRRTSTFHQEILSRILRRLQIHGLVLKVEGRYVSACCLPKSKLSGGE